nr:CHAT domain-containing protein [Streptomyces viridosporus]
MPTAPDLRAGADHADGRRAAGHRPPGPCRRPAPRCGREDPLPYAAEEARMAAAALAAPGTERVGADAGAAEVARPAPSADVPHLACHGVADPLMPPRGGPVPAHGQVLTLSSLLRMRIGARPVVLSAGDSGPSGTASPDEVAGSPTGPLQAGAAAVVASLGEVPDATTLLLRTDFHDRWRTAPEAGTAAALVAQRGAQGLVERRRTRPVHPVAGARSPPDPGRCGRGLLRSGGPARPAAVRPCLARPVGRLRARRRVTVSAVRRRTRAAAAGAAAARGAGSATAA